MAEDQGKPEEQGKKEDQFGFTPEGESLGYISLEQARVEAMRTARDNPGDYGRGFSGVRMVFDVVKQEEGEDYYIITLSVRPEGDFDGRPGEEEFFIEKEGKVAYRQLRSRPRKGKGGFPKGRAAIGVVILAILVVGFLIFVAGDDDNGSKVSPPPTATRPATQPAPTATPTPAAPPAPTPTPEAPSAGSRWEDVSPLLGSTALSLGELWKTGKTLTPQEETRMRQVHAAHPMGQPDFDTWLRVTLRQALNEYLGRQRVPEPTPAAILLPTFTPTPTRNPVVVQPKDDHGDFMEAASFVVEGRSNPGVIDHPGDFDYFQFAASAGQVFSIEVELETHPDTIITLFAQNGDFLDENDDFEGLGRGSEIVFEAPFDGDYFVEVRSLNQDSDTGSYSLSLTYLGNAPAQDDHGSTIEAATGIGAGSIFGELETASDLDFFRIFAKANTNYVAEVRLESHRNTSLALMNRNGILIQENDDAEGLNGGSRITWRTPPIETEYVLMVASMDPGVGTGTYILFVEPIADQHGDSRALATPIVFETNFFGTIDPPDDLDFFRFSAKAGESYVIEAVLDGHPDTVLSLYHFRGLRVNSNDDGEGMDGGSRINWTASSAGDYFIKVKSFDQETQTGGYVLSLVENSISGFYTGTITSFEDGSTGVLELDLVESKGEVDGYLTLYEPHVGSGELDRGYFSQQFLEFKVYSSYQGTAFFCDYFADDVLVAGSLRGRYDCYRTSDEVHIDNGDWSAFR